MRSNFLSFGICLGVLLSSGCYKESQVPEGEIFLKVNKSASIVEADGVSKLNIQVELPMGTLTAKRGIIFSTTKGTFDLDGKNTATITAADVYANGGSKVIASANLVSTTEEGLCVISIRAQNYLRQDTVFFTRAYPNLVSTSVDKLNYKADGSSEITLTTQLKRLAGKGKVSLGQSIKIDAFDMAGLPIGNFRNKSFLVDADGKVSNFFSIPAASGYNGALKIITSVANGPASELSETIIINVQK